MTVDHDIALRVRLAQLRAARRRIESQPPSRLRSVIVQHTRDVEADVRAEIARRAGRD